MSRSPRELERLKRFIQANGITEITVEPTQRYRVNPLGYNYSSIDYAEFTTATEQTNMYKMSIPEYDLYRIVDLVGEFDELMRDPETARQLMEARFINRLKRGQI